MTNIEMMYLSTLSLLLPTVMAIAVYRRLSPSVRILALLIFSTFVLEGIVFITHQLGINNMLLFHIHTYIEFVCISLIYYTIFKGSRIARMLPLLFIGCFIVISTINIFIGEHGSQFNSFQRIVEFGFLLIYFILHLSKLISSRDSPFLENHPHFLLTIGFLIYFTGTLLLFLNVNQLENWGIVDYWMIHGILNIFLNVIYFIVLWIGSKAVKLL